MYIVTVYDYPLGCDTRLVIGCKGGLADTQAALDDHGLPHSMEIGPVPVRDAAEQQRAMDLFVLLGHRPVTVN